MAPNVPSVLELGQKKLVAENFLGVSGPAGLPRPVVERLHAAMKNVARQSHRGATPGGSRCAGQRHDAGAIHRLRRQPGEGVVSAGEGFRRQAELERKNRDRPRFSMPGISIHVVDVSRGVVAAGMKVELYGPGKTSDRIGHHQSAKGLLEVESTLPEGSYEAVFHVADWYREQRVRAAQGSVPRCRCTYRFGHLGFRPALPLAVQVHALGLLVFSRRRVSAKNVVCPCF